MRVPQSRRLSGFELADLLSEHGQDFEQIAHDSVISNVEDWRFRIFVDSDDRLRVLHADQMLNRSGNTDRDVQLGCDSLSRGSDLTIDRQPFSVADRTRGG